MALTDWTSYKDKISAPYQRLQVTKVSLTTVAGRWSSMWLTAPDGGSAPTTAVAPTRATAGAMGQQDSAGVQRLAQVACSLQQSGYMLIADRLSHQGGLSGTVTTAQTTNLATAALTRYTSGVGVMMALEIYSTLGTTGTTVTVSYTNSAGTSGRTSEAVVIGGTGFRETSRFIILPLQQGDVGVKSVESVTVLASTGTAGNFGVTLFKPLFGMPIFNLGSQQFLFDSMLTNSGNMPEILTDACLFYLLNAFTTSSGIWASAIRIIEE